MKRHHEQLLRYELAVIGGGVAGTVAAIAAARLGVKTVLLHNRANLGGPSSAECSCNSDGLNINGASEYHNLNARETGVLEEMKLESCYRKAWGWQQHWSLVLLEWVEKEPNLTLFLNTEAHDVEMDGARIKSVKARVIDSDTNLVIAADTFIDSSGDSVIGNAAGAEFRVGREARGEFNETLAPETADRKTMGSSICFRAADMGRPMPFKAPPWALKFSDEDLPYRLHDNPRQGYWWLEHGGELDTVADNEAIYRKLLAILYGLWDHVKNGGDHGADNYVINWIASHPGKRESRRLMGDCLLTQNDVMDATVFDDAVAYGGWPIDLHPPEGVFGKSHPGSPPPFLFPDIYGIPFRCLYSKNVENLMMAGRNISVTHVALGTTRVMATCALCGQAVGTAAYLRKKYRLTPREIGRERIGELKSLLASGDAALPGDIAVAVADIVPTERLSATSAMPLKTGPITGCLSLAPPPKDLGGVFDPCDVPPADRSRAQMFPVSSGRIDCVRVWMNSELPSPVTLTAKLRAAAKAGDFSAATDIASADAVVPPGLHVAVDFAFAAAVVPGKLCWILLPQVPGVEACVSDRYVPGVYLKRDGCYNDNLNLCFEVFPAQNVFGPENAINGLARAGAWPNMWVSDPAAGLPQCLDLTFGEPAEFNAIEIIFDTNLNKMIPSGAAPECVSDYEIQAWLDGCWRTLFSVTDNHFRRRRHEFAKVRAAKVRLEITKTNGDASARVYEVRMMNGLAFS